MPPEDRSFDASSPFLGSYSDTSSETVSSSSPPPISLQTRRSPPFLLKTGGEGSEDFRDVFANVRNTVPGPNTPVSKKRFEVASAANLSSPPISESSSNNATPTPQRNSSMCIVNLEKLGLYACDLIPDRYRSSRGVNLGIFRIIPAALTFSALAGLMIGPYLFPNTPIFTMTLVVLQVYLAYTAFHMSYYGMKGIMKMKKNLNKPFCGPKDLHHFVLILNYKEDPSILRGTLQALANQIEVEPARSITVVLGMEQREEGCMQKVRLLQSEFGGCFNRILDSYHPDGLPGEQSGKAPNLVWAVKTLRAYVSSMSEENGPLEPLDLDRCTVSVLDADSILANNYFSYLGRLFEDAGATARDSTIWQSCVNCYENFDEVHGSTRFASMIHSMHELSSLSAEGFMFPYSTYSISYRLASRIEGSDVNIFADDWHCYLKSMFANAGNIQVKPMLIPMRCYAAHSSGKWNAVSNRYHQAVRHCYGGAIEMAYLLRRVYEEPKRVALYCLLPSVANALDIVFLVNFHFLIVALPFVTVAGMPQIFLITLNYISSATVCFAHYKYIRLLREDGARNMCRVRRDSADVADMKDSPKPEDDGLAGKTRRKSRFLSSLFSREPSQCDESSGQHPPDYVPHDQVDWRLARQVVVDLLLWGMMCSFLYGSLASLHAQLKLGFSGNLEYVVAGKHSKRRREPGPVCPPQALAPTTPTGTLAIGHTDKDSATLTSVQESIKVDVECDVDENLMGDISFVSPRW